IEKIKAKEGDNFIFEKVLLMADGEDIKIGTPYIEGAKVEVNLLKQGRDKKKIIFRYHSKTRYRKKKGHRQSFSEVKVSNITN
ncbi:50S ribosomal protein L21, partial [Candidatus Wolfebacteria bacterium]|nr:50S ribosomal protein L21 [Candidatus Wolfebacteria bacterium]